MAPPAWGVLRGVGREIGRGANVPINILRIDGSTQDKLLHQEVYINLANIVNLTPHEVTLVGRDGGIILRIPPSGQVARCREVVSARGAVTVLPGGPLTSEGGWKSPS
jgi:hypothetical protein